MQLAQSIGIRVPWAHSAHIFFVYISGDQIQVYHIQHILITLIQFLDSSISEIFLTQT